MEIKAQVVVALNPTGRGMAACASRILTTAKWGPGGCVVANLGCMMLFQQAVYPTACPPNQPTLLGGLVLPYILTTVVWAGIKWVTSTTYDA